MDSPVRNSEWLEYIATLLGGTSRRPCAATFPPDQFWCVLDELPLHLIPAGTLAGGLSLHPGQKQELRLNPQVRVLPHGVTPEELPARAQCMDNFALQGTTAWVQQPATDSLLPFWLGPRLEGAVAAIKQEGHVPAVLPDEEVDLLLTAGIVSTDERAKGNRERWHEAIFRSAEMFHQRDYAPVRSLIHPFHVAALRRYFRYLVRSGRIRLGDEQSSRRYGVHNESVARFFHQQMAKTVSLIVGEPVIPSYVYAASYLSGAVLAKHIDREQCEFSVTLCLDFSPEPRGETSWPIRLDTWHGTVTVYQALGDGLVYRGPRVPHYRDTLPNGQTSTSIFFHYVPAGFTGSLD
jgi:hypothetical protein